MFRITLVCSGLPVTAGPDAARDIAEEFAEHRQWHNRVTCQWDGARLTVQAENDFDKTGRATLDEVSDTITACVSGAGDWETAIESVTEFDSHSD